MIRNAKRKGQDGYALLFVSAMGAAMAILLYTELPRLAFETRRAKEDRLVERAEGYKRGIQLYFRKLKKYPQTLDDLENTNQIRYVRKRYVDPFSGKDDWRLIHTNGTQLTDSLIKKAGTAQAGQSATSNGPPSSFDTQTTGSFGSAAIASNTGQPAGGPRRASEMPGFIRSPDGSLIPDPATVTGQPQNQPQTAYNPGYPPPPTAYGGVPQLPGQPGVPGVPNLIGRPGLVPVQPGQIPGYPTTAANSQNSFGGSQFGGPQTGQQQTAQLPTTGANPALDMIQRILTQPRPGGLPGVQAGATPMASGIVGVASKYDGEGIKLFDERTNIKEWEFVYDPTKDKSGQGSAASAGPAQVGTPIGSGVQGQGSGTGFNSQQGQQPQGGFGQPAFGQQPMPGGFGQQTPLNRPR